MAVIGKIRERSGLLIVLVGGAMVAFILTDLFSNRGGSRTRAVGAIAGEDIDIQEYDRRVGEELDSYRNDFNATVTSQMTEQVRNTVWNDIIREHTLLRQAEDAGFGTTLSKEEYDDIRFGNNILSDFKSNPNFQDQATGQPNKDLLRNYFQNVQTNAPVYHEIQKRRMIENRIISKYNTLVKKSVFVNNAQASDEYVGRNAKATFDLVAMRYQDEPDSLYQVDDGDLNAYYNAHKGDRKYRQKPARSFDYVVFPVIATQGDIDQERADLVDLVNDFRNANDDSLFVVGNTEDRTYVLVPYVEGSADQATDSLILHADTGSVVGPYRDGSSWKLVKVKEIVKVPESRVRHILLSTQGGKPDAEVKERADSILAVVKRDKSKFEALVTKFSEDPGSVQNGGVYEWFDKQKMVPEFTSASFDEPVGAITIAHTSYGYHIIEVLGHRDRNERRLAVIVRNDHPSPTTFKEIYKQANEFSLTNTDADRFETAATEAGLQFQHVDELRSDQRFVPGLQEPFSLINWVNNAEIDAVSAPIEVGESYVVAMLRGIREGGSPALADVKEVLSREIIKEKKAEAFAQKMAGHADLSALASAVGKSVQTASDMAFSSFSIPGGYSETEVIGSIFALQPDATSAPLKGDVAVYVVHMTSLTPAPEMSDPSVEQNALAQRLQGRAETTLFNALKEEADVQDFRGKYY
ncbi:MAG: peptidylprolyl isomerase [Flavobacteriales bacterium]|nr:peptidylprolyl isomerase [Flavobacteriales bacterium]MCB9167367.1 peptidylprolyl isomerase [Flavobacteriales bacterium]